jgi:hypothetical protein
MDTNKVANGLFWHAVRIVFYGVALKFLWGWFMSPAMHAAELHYGVAFGLVCIFCMLFCRTEAVRAITFQNVVEEALSPAFFTLVGFLIHMFVRF